jgi:hypothetical protein
MPDRPTGRGRQSTVPGPPGWVLDVVQTNPTVTRPWRKPRPTKGCRVSKEEDVFIFPSY